MQQILHYIIGAAVGGLIGYFTNFLAIRMLFRPRQEIKIGNFTLPFTPGVIPRRKDHLAREIGETVAEKVFTDTDIHGVFVSEGMLDAVTDGLLSSVFQEESVTAGDLLERVLPGKEADEFLLRLDDTIKEKVLTAIEQNDMSERVAYECRSQIRERVKGTVAARVMTEDKIITLSDYLGRYFRQYLRMHADDLIMPILRQEITGFLREPADGLLNDAGFSKERLKEIIHRGYDEFFKEHAADVVRQFDIAGMTERKIIEFRPAEIEALVNRTIKREMQAVINLGAVLGIIIGLVASIL